MANRFMWQILVVLEIGSILALAAEGCGSDVTQSGTKGAGGRSTSGTSSSTSVTTASGTSTTGAGASATAGSATGTGAGGCDQSTHFPDCCPFSPPSDGSPCSMPGLSCDYGFHTDGSTATCSRGTWHTSSWFYGVGGCNAAGPCGGGGSAGAGG